MRLIISVGMMLMLISGIIAMGSDVTFAEESVVAAAKAESTTPWWVWPLSLFIVTFVLGIVAVLGGVGGGVLFVPIIGGFFPFHIDFVRGAGLLVALAGALAAGPGLLKKGMADLRLALPVLTRPNRAGI